MHVELFVAMEKNHNSNVYGAYLAFHLELLFRLHYSSLLVYHWSELGLHVDQLPLLAPRQC